MANKIYIFSDKRIVYLYLPVMYSRVLSAPTQDKHKAEDNVTPRDAFPVKVKVLPDFKK